MASMADRSHRLGQQLSLFGACRYVQANMLYTLDGLEAQENLDTLNISGNRLQKLENLTGCANLHTLLCSSNELESVEDVAHLAECSQLSTVDLQDNKLADPEVGTCWTANKLPLTLLTRQL